MKQLLNLLTLLMILNSAQAQKISVNETNLLKHYFELKDALVNSDANLASNKIKEVINSLDGDLKLSEPVQKKMIVSTKDIEKMRIAFSELSMEMVVLLKTKKLTNDTVYQEYCPMKKMYWLSNESSIRNPYYGKIMLTCGSVTQIINP